MCTAFLDLISSQAKGEFLVIEARVTNTGREPVLVGAVSLHDIQGRRFDMDISSVFSAVDKLNPGLSSTITVAFDVPSAHGLWWLTVANIKGTIIQPTVGEQVTVPIIVP